VILVDKNWPSTFINRRLTHDILLLHCYLILYHPSVLPSLSEFFFYVQNRKYTQLLLHYTVHKISFPTSLYLPKSDFEQESYARFTSVMKIYPGISEHETLNIFSITPCTGLQIRWFLMQWDENLMSLLNLSFSSFVHLWTSSQKDEDSSIHRGISRSWWFILQFFRHDFSFLLFRPYLHG
jgi:hypothetical protein